VGSAWLAKNDYDKAIDDLSPRSAVTRAIVSFWYYRGDAWQSKGEFDNAIADFTDAIRLCPFGRVRKDAGVVMPGRPKASSTRRSKDYNEAIRLIPDAPVRVRSRGNAWYPRENSTRRSPITRADSARTRGRCELPNTGFPAGAQMKEYDKGDRRRHGGHWDPAHATRSTTRFGAKPNSDKRD